MNTAEAIAMLKECVKSRRLTGPERERWARAFPEDRLFMGNLVVARLTLVEVTELLRLLERVVSEHGEI